MASLIGSTTTSAGGELMKTVKCSDAGMDCPFVARGNTDDEVLSIMADHALNVHSMSNTGDIKNQMRPLIREE